MTFGQNYKPGGGVGLYRDVLGYGFWPLCPKQAGI